MSYTKSFTRGAYLQYVSVFFMAFLWLAVQKVITDSLPVDVYGVYSVFFSMINFCFMMFAGGFPPVVQRYVPQYLAQKQHNALNAFYRKVAAAVLILALIPFAALIAGKPLIARKLNLPDLPILIYALVGLLIVFRNSIQFNNGVLIGFASYGLRAAGELSATVVRLVLIYLCSRLCPGLQNLFIAIAAAYLYYLCFMLFSVRRNFKLLEKTADPPALDAAESREIGRFSISRFINSATDGILDFSFDIYMITWLLGAAGPAQAGLYGLGTGLSLVAVGFNPGRVCFNVLKRTLFLRHDSTQDFDFVLRITRMYIKMLGFFYLPLIVGVSILGRRFIGLFFKSDYLPAADIFIVGTGCMATALTFIGAFYIVTDTLKLKRVHLYERLFLIYNIVLNYILIPKFGILGAVWSTGTTWLLMAGFLHLYLKRMVAIRIDWLAFLKMGLNLVPMAALFVLAVPRLHSIPALAALSAAGFGLYLACSFFNNALDAWELDLLKNALKSRTAP